MVATAAAVGLRDGQTEKAQLTEAADDVPVDRLAPVPLGGVRKHVPVDEVTGELPDSLLLGGESEIHGS